MAVTYTDILTYAPGLTDPAEIVAALQADARYKRDTDAAALYRVLVNEFQVLRVVNGVATGPLEDIWLGWIRVFQLTLCSLMDTGNS